VQAGRRNEEEGRMGHVGGSDGGVGGWITLKMSSPDAFRSRENRGKKDTRDDIIVPPVTTEVYSILWL